MMKLTDEWFEENHMVVYIKQKEAFTLEIQFKDYDGDYLNMSSAVVAVRARTDLDFEETTGDLFTITDGSIDKSKATVNGAAGSILGIPLTTSNLNQTTDFYLEVKTTLGSDVDKTYVKIENQQLSSS